MKTLIILIPVVLLVAVLAVAVVFAVRARERERQQRRDRLEGVVEGHREMADAHADSLDGLREQALTHRQAAVDHTRKAEELEGRIERKERQAAFHEDRALQTQHEREQV